MRLIRVQLISTKSQGDRAKKFGDKSLKCEAFQRCFVSWVAALTRTSADVIAIDGKTLRRFYQKTGAKAPDPHGFGLATRQSLVLGLVKVADKSNEIVAIPARPARLFISPGAHQLSIRSVWPVAPVAAPPCRSRPAAAATRTPVASAPLSAPEHKERGTEHKNEVEPVAP